MFGIHSGSRQEDSMFSLFLDRTHMLPRTVLGVAEDPP